MAVSEPPPPYQLAFRLYTITAASKACQKQHSCIETTTRMKTLEYELGVLKEIITQNTLEIYRLKQALVTTAATKRPRTEMFTKANKRRR